MKKNKLFMTLIGTFAVLALSVTTALAANNLKGTKAQINSNTKQVEYSTDKGTTWGKEAPKGLKDSNTKLNSEQYSYTANKDGSISVLDTDEDEAKGTGVVVRIHSETKEIEYSTDNGKNWSKNIPDGLK